MLWSCSEFRARGKEALSSQWTETVTLSSSWSPTSLGEVMWTVCRLRAAAVDGCPWATTGAKIGNWTIRVSSWDRPFLSRSLSATASHKCARMWLHPIGDSASLSNLLTISSLLRERERAPQFTTPEVLRTSIPYIERYTWKRIRIVNWNRGQNLDYITRCVQSYVIKYCTSSRGEF